MTKKTPPAIRDRIVDFRRVPAADLLPNPTNWRTHPDEQRDALAGVLESVGIVDAVIARETPEGLELIDGHLRQETLTGDIPVIVVDLNDDEAAEVLATFDPLTALAGIDTEKLEGLLDGIHAESEAVDKMLADLKIDAGIFDEPDEEIDAEPQIDRAEELREQWGTEAGQLWALGDHRVLCGDCTNGSPFEIDRADAIVTDPPYCSGGFQEAGKSSGSIGTRNNDTIANDCLSTRGFQALLKKAFAVVPSNCLLCFTDWRMWIHLFDVSESAGFAVRSMIVWDKVTMGMGRGFRNQHELILFGSKVAPEYEDRNSIGNVIRYARTGNINHLTEKPVGLVVELLGAMSFAKTILDPFLGSGTTLIAAEQLNRKCYGIEISPAYVAVTLQRYADATGKQPTLIEDTNNG